MYPLLVALGRSGSQQTDVHETPLHPSCQAVDGAPEVVTLCEEEGKGERHEARGEQQTVDGAKSGRALKMRTQTVANNRLHSTSRGITRGRMVLAIATAIVSVDRIAG